MESFCCDLRKYVDFKDITCLVMSLKVKAHGFSGDDANSCTRVWPSKSHKSLKTGECFSSDCGYNVTILDLKSVESQTMILKVC